MEDRPAHMGAFEDALQGDDAPGYARFNAVGMGLGLVLFVVMLLVPTPEGLELAGWRTAAVTVLMAVWWVTEAIPIPATALLPIVLLPVLGVDSVGVNAAPYANPLIFLFMGGFMIALAMQRWNLHRRIALNIVKAIGTSPLAIIAGFMASCALLSFWISNTAATLMMLPVALSVVELVDQSQRDSGGQEGRNFSIVLLLGLAYASSIGGTGTLIGTPTNGLLVAYIAEQYGQEITFAQWMLIGVPFVVVTLPLAFLVLTRIAYPIHLKKLPGGRQLIEDGLRDMGGMSRPEKIVAVVFALTAVLWMIRPLLLPILPGLSDTGIALFGALLLFALPADLKKGIFVLNWSWASRLPWGVLILFGGGLSLASGISRTGLADWIGGYLSALSAWPLVVLILLSVTLIIFLTELTSNSATAAAFLPILAAVAIVGLERDPLILLIPATLAASCAFMLPVATPPNAIVYGSNRLTILQMVKAGFYLNLLYIILITAAVYALIGPVLGLNFEALPDWAVPPGG